MKLKFAMKQPKLVVSYLKENPSITDILITGGDPMVMKAEILAKYIDAIPEAELASAKDHTYRHQVAILLALPVPD